MATLQTKTRAAFAVNYFAVCSKSSSAPQDSFWAQSNNNCYSKSRRLSGDVKMTS